METFHQGGRGRLVRRLPAIVVLAFGLAGCAAAAIPLTAAEIGVGGFEAFKLVQTSNGGSVGVAFPEKDGKEIPPAPLPPIRRVAVWPNHDGEVDAAERLMQARNFEVVTPGRVRVILADAKMSTNLTELTETERSAALNAVCRHAKVDLVLASRDAGTVNKANGMTLINAQKITKTDLFAYSCIQRTIVWRDQMTVVVEIGDKMPTTVEIAKASGTAWANRIIAAEAHPTAQIGSLQQK